MNSPSSTVQNIVNNQNDSLQSNGNGQIKNVIVVNNNAPSTNISIEETTVTPDVPLSTSDIVSSLLNQGEDIDIYVDNEPTGSLLVESETERLLVEPETGPSRILLDTGIHLTTKEDNTPKKSDTSFKKPRLKRACVIDKAERKKSGLYKLGKHIEGRDGRWKITLTNTSLPMFQCPICDTFLTSPESRITHELEMHSSLLKSINKSVDMVSNPGNTADMVSNPGNTACTQQLSILNYLELYETSKYKTSVVQELIKRTKLLRAFNTLGDDIIGSFKCKYCPYETKLVFVLWAHKQTTHLYLKCEYEKKMRCNYCFLCNRTLPKRTIQLKHFNACIKKQMELPIPIVKRPTKILKCVPCDVRFDSLVELEDHLWGHAKK